MKTNNSPLTTGRYILSAAIIIASCYSANASAASTTTTTSPVAPSCLSITSFTPQIGPWWISAPFTVTNTCATTQSVSNLQLLLSADKALFDDKFHLNNISLTPWHPASALAAAVKDNQNALLITFTTVGSIAAHGSAAGSFGYDPHGVLFGKLLLAVNGSAPTPPPPPPPAVTTGNISYTLINPKSSLFTNTTLPVTIIAKGSGSANIVQSQFGLLSTVPDLNVDSYTLTPSSLASASSGIYYKYAGKEAIVAAAKTTAMGEIAATAITGAVADKITITGLAKGERIKFNFSDSNGYVFNQEILEATSSTEPLIATYKFLNGDNITVHVAIDSKFKAIAPFSIAQGQSAQAFTLDLVKASVVTKGEINFHFYYGVEPMDPMDKMILTGDNYTDLIVSNFIAGVLYGHLIQEFTPGIKFNRDYLYGSLFAQFLQENQSADLYQESTNLLNPSPLQQGVFGVGQGGPYQINNYAADMVHGSYTPYGFSLINYVAIQGNIGYTMSDAGTQYARATPASFNNKYYGPLLAAYFHFNDYKALQFIGGIQNKDTNGHVGDQPWAPGKFEWTPQWQPYYANALNAFKNLANSPLDILLNVAYNQGFYGPLFLKHVKLTESATLKTITDLHSYGNAWKTDTYGQYPYQVHNYLDQLYNNPTPSTKDLSVLVSYDNSVAIDMGKLATIFSNVFQTLGYKNSMGQYVYITTAQANSAFNSARAQAEIAADAVLNLSNAVNRAQIFDLLENAINILEASVNTSFIETTDAQLATKANI